MSEIFNIEKICAELKQKHPLLCQLFAKSIPIVFFMYIGATPFNKRPICPYLINSCKKNDLIQTSSSPLYESLEYINGVLIPKNYIGENSSNATVYNYNVHNTNNLYNSFVQTVYRLPNGSIGISHAPKLEHFKKKNKKCNFYELQNNFIEIAPITFGTGEYLNKNGFVVILTGYTVFKLLIVFITD
jgi:hypothetical protein